MSIPIRVRLTIWYAALMGTIIVALGMFLVSQLGTDLRQRIDNEVVTSSATIIQAFGDGAQEVPSEGAKDRAEDTTDLTQVASVVLPHSTGATQLLSVRGEVIARYGSVAGTEPMVTAAVLRAALEGKPATFTAQLGEQGQRHRVRATALFSNGQPTVLVVAVSLEWVEHEVWEVSALVLIGGLAALGASSFAAFWLAYKALRPVRRMTLDAEQIGADRLDERIAVPDAQDEIGHLAVTLNAMLDRIELGATKQRRLVADASHELRSPLAVMRAEIDVSLRGDELSPTARDVLVSAREEVDQMSRSVDNMLTLAAADEGRLELLTSCVNLRQVIEDAARPLQSLAVSKGITVLLEGGPCEAKADPQRLHLALTNLIENALKFTQAGGQVRILCWQRDGVAGITVRDNGPGISPQDCVQLFDRFHRVDTARGRIVGGSGLGLAICREVAVAHGGKVWVESEVGRGSAFLLELPKWRVSQASPGSTGSTPSGADLTESLRSVAASRAGDGGWHQVQGR